MCVPLRDQSGKVRYYLGAQLDITDLVNDCTGLQSLKKLVQRHTDHRNLVKKSDDPVETLQQDEFEQLSETFNPQELEKLVKLRQRQQFESEEKLYCNGSLEEQDRRASSRVPLADLDSTFQFNGEGSAPPLGYYKTVSHMHKLSYSGLTSTVPPSPPLPFPSDSLRLPRSSYAWDPPITALG